MSLRDAVETNNVGQVERNLYWCTQNRSCSFSYDDAYGRSLLHVAAAAGRLRVVRRLIAAGAEVDACSTSGGTPLSAASSAGKPGVVGVLLRHGARPDAHCPFYLSDPLCDAAKPAIARKLLRAGASPDKPGPRGETPLHCAAGSGRADVVALLLAEGAAAEPPRRENPQTPLHRAIMSGDPATVGLLLGAGANLNSRFNYDTGRDRGATALIETALRDQVEISKLLLDAGADANSATEEGRTPLLVANSPEMLRLLLAAGARIEGFDTDGETALHHAASATNPASSTYVSSSDRPEDLARRRDWFARQTESLKLLIDAGADPFVKSREGATPLHSAAKTGNLPAIEYLLQHKADVAARDSKGATPLHHAAGGGSVEAAKLLLDAGADVNALTLRGDTPSSWARSRTVLSDDNHTRMLKLLRERGATAVPAENPPPAATATASAAASAALTSAEPGRFIDKSNSSEVAASLSPAHSWLLERGAKLRLAEYRKASLPQALSEATRLCSDRGYPSVSMDLTNYVAGLPFPHVDVTGQNAATMLMLNVEAANSPDDLHVTRVACDTGSLAKNSVQIERHYLTGDLFRLAFTGRWQAEPKPLLEPNRDAVRYKEAVSSLAEPFDLKGSGWVTHRYQASDKPMITWLYIPSTRRVRRLSTVQRSQPLFGQDIDLDSVDGLAAPASSFQWRLLGERSFLSPFRAESMPVQWSAAPWNFLPDLAWEPRRVWEIEGTPKEAGYSYSKRVVYVDQETYRIVASTLYDGHGELSKLWLSGWKFDDMPGNLAYTSSATMIDLQLDHATWCSLPSRQSETGGWYINTGVMEECLVDLRRYTMGAERCPPDGSPMRTRLWN